jgi:transcriptional regulator with XRE-family HTH domain
MPRAKTQTGLTVRELSEATGISQRQISRNLADGCPRDSSESVMAWRAANVRDPYDTNGSVAPASGTIGEARLQLVLRQTEREIQAAEKLSIANAERRGELIERAEVLRDTTLALSRLRNRLEGIGSAIATIMPAETKAVAKAAAEQIVRLALKELAAALREPHGETE